MNEDRVLAKRVNQMAKIQGTIRVLKRQMNKYKVSILNSMVRRNMKHYKDNNYTVSLIKGYKKLAFSNSKLRDVNPLLYKQLHEDKRFQVVRKRKPSIRIRRHLLN